MTDVRNERDSGVSNLALHLLGLPFAYGVPAELYPDAPQAVQVKGGRSQNARESYEDARTRRLLVKTLGLIRKALNISQTDMAKRMGTSQSAVSEIEKGMKDPRLSTLQRMARSLGVELHVSISMGAWLLQAWDHRHISYDASVRPIKMEEGLEDLWIAAILERQRDPLRMILSTEKTNVKEIESVDPRYDRYANGGDVFGSSTSFADEAGTAA